MSRKSQPMDEDAETILEAIQSIPETVSNDAFRLGTRVTFLGPEGIYAYQDGSKTLIKAIKPADQTPMPARKQLHSKAG